MGIDHPRRRAPPAQVLGLAALANGGMYGILMITVAQLLAARGVSELRIAAITGFATIPGTIRFLLAPMLDVGFSRRTYATALALMMAGLTALACNLLGNLTLLPLVMFAGMACYYLYTPAAGGWFSQVINRADEPVLGAWLSASSGAGFGLMPALGIVLIHLLPFQIGVGVICLLCLAPLILFAFVPHEPTPTLGFGAAFGPLWRDIGLIVRDRNVWRMMLLFAMPCATFSLTNTLSGIGSADFHASEAFVGVVGGIGGTVGTLVGALTAPLLTRWVRPVLLYLLIGVTGALFTLILMGMARTPMTYAVAMIGENVFQGAAFATALGLILLSVGKNNPVASTHFALIDAALIVPISYMPVLDGLGYDRGGILGNLGVDAALGLGGSTIMALLFFGPWRDTVRAEAV